MDLKFKKMPNYMNGNSKQEHELHLTVMHPCLLSILPGSVWHRYVHMYGYAFYMSLYHLCLRARKPCLPYRLQISG